MSKPVEYIHAPSFHYWDDRNFTLPNGTQILLRHLGGTRFIGEVREGKIFDLNEGTFCSGLNELFEREGIDTYDAYSEFSNKRVRIRNPGGAEVALSGIVEYQRQEKIRLERARIAQEERELGTKFEPGVLDSLRARGRDPKAIVTHVADKNSHRINRGLGLYEFRFEGLSILASAGGRVHKVGNQVQDKPKPFPRISYSNGCWREGDGSRLRL